MIKIAIAIAAVLFAGAGAAAQDYTGNVDPSAYSLPTVMHSAIDARAKSDRRRVRPTSAQKAAAACANLPRTRAILGAGNWRVLRLARLCRQAGFLR
jgi:hypothetical protein